MEPTFAARNRSQSGTSADTSGNRWRIRARPPSRLTPPRRSLAGLLAASTNRNPRLSIRSCTSSSRLGSFWISSMITGPADGSTVARVHPAAGPARARGAETRRRATGRSAGSRGTSGAGRWTCRSGAVRTGTRSAREGRGADQGGGPEAEAPAHPTRIPAFPQLNCGKRAFSSMSVADMARTVLATAVRTRKCISTALGVWRARSTLPQPAAPPRRATPWSKKQPEQLTQVLYMLILDL